jgi:hypothetical protein
MRGRRSRSCSRAFSKDRFGPPSTGPGDGGHCEASIRLIGEATTLLSRAPGERHESAEQSPRRRQAELGRLLAAAEGYRVVASDGTHVGWLDHVRYERHADHPDEIVIRRRGLLPKRRRA